jgi:type IV secretion system protein VirB11
VSNRIPAPELSRVHIEDERTVRLDQYVERLTRYLTPSLTERLFGDPDVNDFQINSDGWIWLDRHSAGRVHEGDFMPSERLEMFINAVAEHLGTVFDARNAVLEGELPNPVFGGARFTAFGPPTASPPAIVVRKRAQKIFNLSEYRDNEIATQAQVDVLEQAILAGLNIVVCGAMRSGKTTFLNALLAALAQLRPRDRAVLVEDTPELQPSLLNTQRLVTGGKRGFAKLERPLNRTSGDWTVFGEVRGSEVLSVLKMWLSDSHGFMTFHGSDAEGVLERMNLLAMENRVPPQRHLIAKVAHVLVFLEGGSVRRRVREVVRVDGFDARERRFLFHRLA